MRTVDVLVLLCALLALVGCAAHPMHLSVPLQTGKTIPVTLHTPSAWECMPVTLGALTCTNITDDVQIATVGGDRVAVPGHTNMTIEETPSIGIRL
jgi:hypothetical protein